MDRRIRVLHLIDSLELGGAQTVLLNWFSLADERFELSLAALHANDQSLFLERARRQGLSVCSLSPYRWVPWFLISLPWIILRKRFDIVHCHLYASNWLGKPLARFLGVPVVISHDHCYEEFRFKNPFLRWIDGGANACADVVLAISEQIAQRLREHEKIPAARVEVIRNGVPSGDPASNSVKSSAVRDFRVIGGAGRMVAWKGFSRLLHVTRHLLDLDERYRLILAGDGPELRNLQALARSLEIEDRIAWPGAVASLAPFFAQIDLFVLTSEREDLPMVLLEALAAGKPSAVLEHNRERRTVTEAALLLDPASAAKAWAAEIHRLFSEPVRMKQLREAGPRFVSEKFSAEKQVRRIEEIYDSLLAKKGKQRGRSTKDR